MMYRLLLTCGIHYRKAHYSSKDCKNASPPSKVSTNRLRSPKCCSCTNIKSRMAADCFAAAGRLQYTSFQTNSVDLNDALLLSFHDWMDAGRQYFGTGGRASYGRQQQRTHVAAREDGDDEAG